MKKIAHALLVTAMAGGMAVASATGASAAHCGDGPGFSGFGTHAGATTDAEGSKAGPHTGTSGASNCNQNAQEKRADASKP